MTEGERHSEAAAIEDPTGGDNFDGLAVELGRLATTKGLIPIGIFDAEII